MAGKNLSIKIGLPYIRKCLNGSLDSYLLLFLNDFLNDEQELTILTCFFDNYCRLPAGKILTVLLTI